LFVARLATISPRRRQFHRRLAFGGNGGAKHQFRLSQFGGCGGGMGNVGPQRQSRAIMSPSSLPKILTYAISSSTSTTTHPVVVATV